MSDEDITLREYIDIRFNELEKRLTLRFDLTDKALMLASSKVAEKQGTKQWAIGIWVAIGLSIAALLCNIMI